MPRNPDKQRCGIPGCKAWAMRNHGYCTSHLRKLCDRALRGGDEHGLLPRLVYAMDAASRRHDLGDLDVIDEELRSLFAVRSLFLAWVKEHQGVASPLQEPPTRFLRAWSDSSGRVIQLLRARRELGGGAETSFEALMETVRTKVDEILGDD